MKITKEEVLKLAQLSRIELFDDEIEPIAKQLQEVLTYAERVSRVSSEITAEFDKNINIFRDDIIQKTNPEPLLALAPESEDNFFIVPKILEDK